MPRRKGASAIALATCVCALAACDLQGGSASEALTKAAGGQKGRNAYDVTPLVSDIADGFGAPLQDPLLVNAWGLAAGPTTFWWVANNGSQTSTLYDGQGGEHFLVDQTPVDVPDDPSGLVFNDGSTFTGMVTDGTNSGVARFIFASEGGTIRGWSPTVGVPPGSPAGTLSTVTEEVVSPTPGCDATDSCEVYKAIALAEKHIFVTDFHNGHVDVFDSSWNPVSLGPNAFVDPEIPPGYAPFGIRFLDGKILVTYALQNGERHDDVAGAGHGFIDAYGLDGDLLFRVATRAQLNSPWGLVIAPDDFGKFSGQLLVGNFGNGLINVYDLSHCTRNGCSHSGQLHGERGGPIRIDGLWAIDFGQGPNTGNSNSLYFTSGPNGENDGLFGFIAPAD